jgi:DNA-directed RNA polymerase specialized sigma24 family protein
MCGIVRVLSATNGTDEEHAPLPDDFDLFQSGVPTAEVKLIADENLARLMDALDPDLQTVAELRLRCTIPEAARTLGISESTYKRRLGTIREIWRAAGLVNGHHS